MTKEQFIYLVNEICGEIEMPLSFVNGRLEERGVEDENLYFPDKPACKEIAKSIVEKLDEAELEALAKLFEVIVLSGAVKYTYSNQFDLVWGLIEEKTKQWKQIANIEDEEEQDEWEDNEVVINLGEGIECDKENLDSLANAVQQLSSRIDTLSGKCDEDEDEDAEDNEDENEEINAIVEKIENLDDEAFIKLWNEYLFDNDHKIYGTNEEGLMDFFGYDLEKSDIISIIYSSINFPRDWEYYSYFARNAENNLEFFDCLGEFSVYQEWSDDSGGEDELLKKMAEFVIYEGLDIDNL